MLSTMRPMRTYRRQVERLDGESQSAFTSRAERIIPDLRAYVHQRHPARHIRAIVHYSDDWSIATVEVAALKDRWEQ